MAQLRPGGMALIIGGKEKELIGLCVTTEEFISPGSTSHGKYADGCPVMNCLSSSKWVVTNSIIGTPDADGVISKGWALVSAGHLLPIDGDDYQLFDVHETGWVIWK